MVAVAECVKVESSGLPGVWDSDIDKFAAAEIAAALTLTKRAAWSRLADAQLLIWFTCHAGGRGPS